jgi:hypothetical protein
MKIKFSYIKKNGEKALYEGEVVKEKETYYRINVLSKNSMESVSLPRIRTFSKDAVLVNHS